MLAALEGQDLAPWVTEQAKMLFGSFLSLLAAVSSVASVTISPHVRHEHRRGIPDGWNLVRRAPPTTALPLKVGLVQPNLDQLEKHLLDVSHPDSPNYGQHWSPAKIAQTFRPSKDSVDTVLQWLTSEGIGASRINLSKTGGWVEANVSVKEAEALLKTQYSVYEHAATGAEHLACGSAYHLPEHVSNHVELVTPTLHFDVKLKREPVDVLGKRSAQFKPGIAKSIGQPGAGVVTPKTTGRVKVSGPCARLDPSAPLMNLLSFRKYYKDSPSATNLSHPTVCALCTVSRMSLLLQRKTASASVRVLRFYKCLIN